MSKRRLEEIAAVYQVLDAARALGSRVLRDGTELIGHVPHIAPEAWLHVLFPGLDAADIRQTGEEAGHRMEPSFARFLAYHNGLSVFSGALYLYGLRKRNRRRDLDDWEPFSIGVPNVKERPKDAQGTHLFVGGYSDDGSRLYVDTATAVVYRCARHSVEPWQFWPSFFEMLESEVARLAGLFDEGGRRSTLGPKAPAR
ncbi:MAG: SMI1/KNR4 family protein [Gemmatimonadaceae bacterium]